MSFDTGLVGSVLMTNERIVAAIAAIDAINAEDPHTLVVDGVERPKELAHAEMMSEWVERLRPDANEEQRLAARAHHIKRWSLPRSSFSNDRKGYLRWRTALKKVHADLAGDVMAAAGYDASEIRRVQAIVQKKNLKEDPDVQTHEDALCLVFIETQFSELADRLETGKMVDVVRKTLAKMSPDAIEFALALDLADRDRAIIAAAAAPAPDTLSADERMDR